MRKTITFICTRKFAVIALLLPCIIAVIIWSVTKHDTTVTTSVHRKQLARSKRPDWMNGSSSFLAKPTGFVVDTPSCRIPDFDAFNPSILPYVRDPAPRFNICSQSLPVTFTDRQFIRLNTTLAQSLGIKQCFYQKVSYRLYLGIRCI